MIVIGQFAYNRYYNTNTLSPDPIDKSIAVMPFINLSKVVEQDYFSDGMMAEIVNKLFKIEGLSVTSRTTSMKYKNTKLSAREIASELGVGHILEGDVMIIENDVRILINLIDGKEDKSNWTDEYNASLDEIFKVQSEIAQTVAHQLKVEITPQTKSRVESDATDNPEAWKLLMKARFEEENTGDVDKITNLLLEAIAIEPEFGPAYADLGFIWLLKGSYEGSLEVSDIF